MSKRKADKSAPKSASSPPKNGQLVPALNGGMIRHGSLPGNTPGSGRPKEKVLDLMDEALEKTLASLVRKQEAGLLMSMEEIALLGQCAKYRLNKPREIITEDLQDRVHRLLDLLEREYGMPEVMRLRSQITEILTP